MPFRLGVGFLFAVALVVLGFTIMTLGSSLGGCDPATQPECQGGWVEVAFVAFGLAMIWIGAPAALIGIPVYMTG